MNTQEILARLEEDAGGDKTAMLHALEDGAALAALGVTDADQEAVEEAHFLLKQSIKND